jgi:glycosyltransferase involved in cell wall biosynthesis
MNINKSLQLSLANRSVTIVIPVHNEEGNLELLFQKLHQTFEYLGCTLPVLVIDDGSVDRSIEILEDLSNKYSFFQLVCHPARRGVAQVLKTALINVATDWILWEQADLESDPLTDIPLLLEACHEGVDCVAGWRQNRGDGKTLASRLANWSCQKVFNLHIHDMNWIKLVRRDIMAAVPLEIVTHRYALAVLSGWGFNVTEVPTPWHPRHSGVSKFGRKRLYTSAIDFIKTWRWFSREGYAWKPVIAERKVLTSMATFRDSRE